MPLRKRYRKRVTKPVTAVQLNLETPGFTYRKWGGVQTSKAGDWVVDNGGEVYTVDAESFARTYTQTGPGRYVKSAPVWAEIARGDGEIATKEGTTRYRAGDYLVFNNEDGSDGYSMSAERFIALYEQIDP